MDEAFEKRAGEVEKMEKLKTETDSVLTVIKQRVYEVLGDKVRQIILFGSRSRGDAEKDSDYDILLLVERRTRALEDQIDDIAYEMLDGYGAVVVIFVFEVETFEQETQEPLFCNIRREGLVL
jgi:predicted nucleotidyltransferase